ncbi:hypothetical protein CDAR_385311 [Caerostris darwini]|uniref:Uncharacterized protein n=1 Tax=Caerostris darwini TaxID=1538125 RepID=A0AAV4NXN4_9ARAC|nr:hypothetical protein CDAR_385311 [Caerostris darwini]
MCEHAKLHIRNPAVDWTSTGYYATLYIHYHHLPCQFVRQNSMDRAHIPALGRRLRVDRPYEVLFFLRGLERIEASVDSALLSEPETSLIRCSSLCSFSIFSTLEREGARSGDDRGVAFFYLPLLFHGRREHVLDHAPTHFEFHVRCSDWSSLSNWQAWIGQVSLRIGFDAEGERGVERDGGVR